MSMSSFQHTYKQMFGVNVMTDIIHSRLQYAKALLATTDLTLDSIAAQSGYSNAFHLMRQFKAKLGLTPTEYRKQHK
jgi:AraC family transcriptional regulator of arabinose operon